MITHEVCRINTSLNSIINCTLPANLPYGKLYRVRVISINPAITGKTGSDTLTIHAKPSPAPTITPAGDTTICNGTSITLSANTGYTAYAWNSSESTGQIQVDTTGAYRVTVTTGCQGTSAATNVSLKNKPVLSNITGPKTVSAGQVGVVYSVQAKAGVTYTWTIPAGATITTGQGTASIKVTRGTTSGKVMVKGSNDCGTSAAKSLNVTVTTGLIALINEKQLGADQPPKLYPNPSPGSTTMVFYAAKEYDYLVDVRDITGRMLQQLKGKSIIGSNIISLDMSSYAQGTYMIVLKNKKQDLYTFKFIKE